MAVSFSITRNTTRFHDSNGNGVKDAGEVDLDFGEVGVYDPGDILYTRITLTNTGDQPATGVTLSDNFSGSTFVDAGNVVSGTPFINVSPIASNDTFQAIGNTVLRVGTAGTLNGGESTTFAGNLLSNDVGSLAGDSISGFQIDVVGDGTFAGSGITAKGGHYNILADGSFNYVNSGSDVSLTDGDSFTYTIRDKGFDGVYNTADDLTSTATVTITFAEQSPGVAHRVWYVDSNAAPGGDGTSANPFQTMAVINGVTGDGTTGDDLDQAGEYIYVENGAGAPVTGPITLENGQQLIGDGVALVVAGSTLATATTNSTLTAASGTIVTLGSGNTIAGLNIGAGTGTATGISGTNFGTLTVNTATINAGGQALNLTTGSFQGSGFTSTDSDGGTSNVSLVSVTGDVALGTGALAGATGNAINVSNATGAAVSTGLTYAGSVTHSGTGALLNVDGGTAGHLGTINLTGTKSATAGTGLNFENADGDYTVTGTTTLNGGNAGIDIVSNTAGNGAQGSGGSFTFGGTFTINNPGGSAVVVSDSTVNVNFDVDVTQSSNFAALDVTNHSVGTFTFQTTASINATNGTGLQFSNADGIYTMSSANTLNGGDAGIDIDTGSGGNFSFISNTSITNPTGDALVVDNSTATLSYGGSITDNSGRVVNINQHDTSNNITFTTTSSINATAGSSGILIQESGTGGTIAFNGQVQLATTTNTAITLTNNTGKTINFNADDLGLDITTTTGSGIVASNGGTITVSDVGSGNTINVTAGGAGSAVAFSALSTTIGAGGVTFDTISQSGGASGIVLNATGSGAFTVLGTGGANSGGTITGVSGVGINLTNTGAVSLTRMLIQNGGDDGIRGSTVNGFTLSNSTVLNNGNADEEHGVDLSNVTGALLLDTVTVRGSFEHNFKLNNQTGTLNTLNIKNSTFDHTAIQGGAAGGNGVFVTIGGTAVLVDGSISGSTFRNNFGNGILINSENSGRIGDDNAAPTSTNGFVVSGSTFDDNNIAIQFGQFHTSDLTVDIQNNTIINDNRTATSGTNSTSMAIVVGSSAIAGAGSSLNARIEGNTIGNAAIDGSGSAIGSGIRVIVQGLTDATVVINNNTIRETPNGYGIEATFLGPQDDLGVVPTSDITVTNNNVDHTNYPYKPGTSDFPLPAIYIAGDNQAGAAAAPTVRADVRGNTVPTALPPVGFISGFTNNWLEVYEYDGSSPGNISLLDTGPANPNATSELTANNTGRSGANANVALFTGSITTAPDLSPLPINAEAPPPPPPVIVDPVAPPPVVVGPPPPPPPAPTPAPAGPVVVDDGVLSQAEIDFMVDAAIQRWAAAGATDEQIAAMRAVKVSVSDMGGLLLGESGLGTITLDSDAAGWRWFVDSTPGDDSEYVGSGTRLAAANPNGMAGTRIDLLTVITHELGHQIGLSDISAPGAKDELMYGTIGAGERRLPGSDDFSGAADGPVTGAFAFAPITLGTIPAGQTVIVEFRHVIDNPGEDRLVGAWAGQATIDSNETDPQLSNVETGNIDGLTLGDLVFKDVNKDGNYDVGTDTLLAGVTVSLFGDTNNNGVYDEGVDLYVGYNEVNGTPGYQQGVDTPAAPGTGTALTATTLANGTYSFGSLAPGDYIVRIDSTNFGVGGALQNLLITPGVAADPDDNVDNDNNGVAAGSAVVSQAIRLDYNSEPTAGPGNDTNNTVDFGFFAPNAPPVFGALNGDTGTYYENGAPMAIDIGQNATVTDGDSANFDGGSLTLSVNGSTGDRITFGPGTSFDGSNNVFVGATNIGTLSTSANQIVVTFNANATAANVQTLVRAFLFDVNSETPVAGTRTFTFTLVDGDGNDGGLGNDTGTASTTIEVVPVSDAPEGADRTGTGLYDSTGATYAFTVADFATGFADPNDSPANTFSGVRITTLPAAAAGIIYFDSNLADATPPVAIAAGDSFTAQDLTDGKLTFVGAAGSAGMAMSFTFQVIDNGTTANGGIVMDASPNTFSTTILQGNIAPVLDLDASGAGTGFASAYTEGGAAAAISDTDVSITDANAGDNIAGATIEIANAAAGDVLTVVGALPGSITVDLVNSTATKLVLTGTGTRAQYETAIEQITFSNTGNNPTLGGTNTSRTINVTVNDGNANSNVAVATVTVADDNADAPSGTDATITAIEDTFRLIEAVDLGFSDDDGTFASVTISAVSGGSIYFDADGSAGGGIPMLATLPQTYTAQDLADGKVSFKAAPNANGVNLGTITFAVRDDDGNVDASPNTLTVTVTAVNDSPELTTGGPIAATEQTAVAILPAGSVVDVDLAALNGGNGNYAGASFSVNRNPAVNPTEDVFTLVAGPNFTIVGSDLRSGGLTFGTISVDGTAGSLVINFTSTQTIATSALVNEVIQAVRYTNTSDTPPASVVLAVGFTDGSPANGQGTGATNLDVNLVTVNITATNDAPALDLNGAGGGFNAVLNFNESTTPAQIAPAATLTDVDSADFDGGSLIVVVSTNQDPGDFLVIFNQGTNAGEIGLGGGGTVTYSGVSIGTWGYAPGSSAQINVSFNANATPAAVEALVRQFGYFTNTDTPSAAARGILFSLTDGDGGTINRQATVNVTPVDDPAVAQDDAVSTPENAIGTGSLFTNDFDPEGNPFAITKFTIAAVDYAPGTEVVLASGATLKVNADGSYIFDPKGKYNTLTDNTSGAVNISALGVTFDYTVTGGDTASATVTVTGVATDDDELHGNSGPNTINGTAGTDVFILTQGGNDIANGFASSDLFIFRAAMTSQDAVDGGSERDQIAIQGDYTGANALTLGTGVINVESFVLVPGNNTNRGDPGTNFYSYHVTTVNENVAADQVMTFDGAQLRVGENFTFRGAAETDGGFRVVGGLGNDDFIGGSKTDVFLFNDGAFGASDVVNGGAGVARDQLALRGDYTLFFGAGQITSIESLAILSGYDVPQQTDYDYLIVMNDNNLLGGSMTVDAAQLRSDETFTFFGNNETDGTFKISGGAGDDQIIGGQGADRIKGNAGTDNIYGHLGGDELWGGAGGDRFAYDFTSHSAAGAIDKIMDFATGDVIALNTIDAIAGGADDAFTFIGAAAFTLGTAGQLRAYEDAGQAGHWFVEADVNGDALADLVIEVYTTDLQPLDAIDFQL